MSSVSYANKILDEAERKLLKNYSKAELINLVNSAWNIGVNGSQYKFTDLANNGKVAVNAIKKTNGIIGLIGTAGNWIIADANDETLDEKLVGLGTDLVMVALGFTGVGVAINVAYIAMGAVGFDLSGWIKSKYRGDKIDSLDWVSITKSGFLQVTMPDGTVYSRPFMPNAQGSLFGNGKDDVLIGGDKKDIFIGHGGNDIFVGKGGKDDYFVSYGDTIIDSDGKGRVFLSFTNIQLTGGTQIEKGSKIYKGKDGTTYELKGSDFIINDNITIENFSNDNLEIHLSEFDEINVSISDNQAVEKAGKMTFNIELSKEPELGQFVIVKVNDKTYKFVNFLETNYTFEDGVKLIHGSSATYEYTWSDDSLKEEDEKFEVSATATGSDGLKVSVIKNGNGLIKDDDRDDDPDPEREYSPIVIDLGNDGINSHALNYTINFDLDNNGFKEATGWVSGDDALLAIDKNNNGIIDNGSELFGNKSISDSAFSYTNSSLNNGFETLKNYDTNNDGIIDNKDEIWDKLILWQDKDEKFANLNLLVA